MERVIAWGRNGFAVVVDVPGYETGAIINCEQTASLYQPKWCRVLSVCTSLDAARAALRLLKTKSEE